MLVINYSKMVQAAELLNPLSFNAMAGRRFSCNAFPARSGDNALGPILFATVDAYGKALAYRVLFDSRYGILLTAR